MKVDLGKEHIIDQILQMIFVGISYKMCFTQQDWVMELVSCRQHFVTAANRI